MVIGADSLLTSLVYRVSPGYDWYFKSKGLEFMEQINYRLNTFPVTELMVSKFSALKGQSSNNYFLQ